MPSPISYLELLEGEAAAHLQLLVVPGGLAVHDRAEETQRAGSHSEGLRKPRDPHSPIRHSAPFPSNVPSPRPHAPPTPPIRSPTFDPSFDFHETTTAGSMLPLSSLSACPVPSSNHRHTFFWRAMRRRFLRPAWSVQTFTYLSQSLWKCWKGTTLLCFTILLQRASVHRRTDDSTTVPQKPDSSAHSFPLVLLVPITTPAHSRPTHSRSRSGSGRPSAIRICR